VCIAGFCWVGLSGVVLLHSITVSSLNVLTYLGPKVTSTFHVIG